MLQGTASAWPAPDEWFSVRERSDLPRRIHVIGWAGSGKTHLSRRLAQIVEAPTHELDVVAYGPTTRRTAEERRAQLAEVTASPRWVTEGIYLWWIDDLLRHADLVVWLDLPRRTAARRILTRHLSASLRRNNRHKGLRRLWTFWWGVRDYYTAERPPPTDVTSDGSITRDLTIEELRKAGDRLVVCRRPRDVDRLVSALRSLRPAS